MNTFYKHLQPNIIKFSDEQEIPESLRCHYAINYNVWGIDYFFENYLLQESSDGVYMILNENNFGILLEDTLSDQKVLDIPRLYIKITDKFLTDDSKFQEFILKAAKDNEIYGLGIDGFRPGEDYYINHTLFNYLSNIVPSKDNNEETPQEISYGLGNDNEEETNEEEYTGPKEDPEFRFSEESITVKINSTYNLPTLISSQGVDNVKYYVSNINVARIDTTSGQVFIENEGETLILAVFEGNNRYNASQATYTLIVQPEEDTTYSSLNIENELPNYLDENGNITKYFIDLDGEIIKDYTNLDYFNKKNNLLTFTYSEDELNRFYQNICQIILNNTTIQNNTDIFYKPNNQIYYKVLQYFSNSKVDDASIALNLILGSQYGTVSTNNQLNCGCSTGSSSTLLTQSCSVMYEQAMPLYLKQMFGDSEFYEDWFNIYLSESDIIPNDVLIETLQLFIKEFILLDYNLDQGKSSLQYQCDCTDLSSLNNSSLEYKKLNNFLQILNWVNNSRIDENTNKIKIYGESFGELLPNLQF